MWLPSPRQGDNAKNKSPAICLNLQSKGKSSISLVLLSRTLNLPLTGRRFLKRRIPIKFTKRRKFGLQEAKALCAPTEMASPQAVFSSPGGHRAEHGPGTGLCGRETSLWREGTRGFQGRRIPFSETLVFTELTSLPRDALLLLLEHRRP